MNLNEAQTIANSLAEKYLFSRQLQFAGFDDDDDLADEGISGIFQSITGLGVGLNGKESYVIRFYHTAPVQDTHLIAEECKISENDMEFQQIEPFFAQSIKPFSRAIRQLMSRRHLKERPVKVGCSVGRFRSSDYGSAGCFVKKSTNEIYLLSNHHVLFDVGGNYDDRFIVQPGGGKYGGREDIIGQHYESMPFHPDEINEFDAALAGPLNCGVSHTIRGFDDGVERNLRGYEAADHEVEVYKFGVTSKLTFGIVTDLNVSIVVGFGHRSISFKNLILIKGYDNTFQYRRRFSKSGDSGSVVVARATDCVIGLLFAGSSSGLSLACPVAPIFRQFGVDLFL